MYIFGELVVETIRKHYEQRLNMAQNPENITERLADYIAGRLSDADARALEADAALDPTLAAELEFTKQLAAGLKSDPDAIPANDLG
ncbi:MAG: hypothetical protein AAFQ67_00765, partial [Pseudomonadota bacterium]